MRTICLYYKELVSSHIKKLSKEFGFDEFVDMNQGGQIVDSEVYLVDISDTSKETLLSFKNALSKKEDKLIYFFSDATQNLMFFQLAFLVNAKAVFTSNQDYQKIALKIQSDYKNHQKEHLYKKIGTVFLKEQPFLIYNSHELIFANTKFFDEFVCSNLEDVKRKIISQIDIGSLLKSDSKIEISLDTKNGKNSCRIKSISLEESNEKYIYFEQFQKEILKENKLDFIQNRINFIENIKEKLLEQSISKNLFGIFAIQVENMHKLQSDWNDFDIEMMLRDLMLQINIILNGKFQLAQYENELFITLMEGFKYQELKKEGETFYKKITEYTSKQKIMPIIGIYVLDINAINLNAIISVLRKISKKEISQEEINLYKIHYITSAHESLDEKEAIKLLFKSAFTNKSPIKLLSIYKGLCINTASSIVKFNDDEIQVTFEPLQGSILKMEKETVIQSSNFPKDIKASVKFIDFDKKIAILYNFTMLKGSANSRKYSRVTCSQRTPIVLSHFKGTLNGEILDISVKSIAIKVRVGGKSLDNIKSRMVTLGFTLPTSLNFDGYIKLNIQAKVLLVICDEEYCKIVTDLEETDQSAESILMEYVYNRQKEIITEVKKISKG